MTKVAALKTNALVLKSPTVKTRAALPVPRKKWKQFDEFEEAADRLIENQNDQAEANAGDAMPPIRAYFSGSDFLKLVEIIRTECRAQLAEYDPPSAYDDERDLKYELVAKRIGIMLTAFRYPPSESQTKLLVEHVSAIPDLSMVALESGCRQIEDEAEDRAPGVGAIKKILRGHIKRWRKRRSVIEVRI